jgi:hypothetical protein
MLAPQAVGAAERWNAARRRHARPREHRHALRLAQPLDKFAYRQFHAIVPAIDVTKGRQT